MPGVGGMTPALPTNLPDRPDMPFPKLDLGNIGSSADVPLPPSFPAPGTILPGTTPPDATAPGAAKTSEAKPADAPPSTPDTGEKKQPE
jgi:hypothetical protein